MERRDVRELIDLLKKLDRDQADRDSMLIAMLQDIHSSLGMIYRLLEEEHRE